MIEETKGDTTINKLQQGGSKHAIDNDYDNNNDDNNDNDNDNNDGDDHNMRRWLGRQGGQGSGGGHVR